MPLLQKTIYLSIEEPQTSLCFLHLQLQLLKSLRLFQPNKKHNECL